MESLSALDNLNLFDRISFGTREPIVHILHHIQFRGEYSAMGENEKSHSSSAKINCRAYVINLIYTIMIRKHLRTFVNDF